MNPGRGMADADRAVPSLPRISDYVAYYADVSPAAEAAVLGEIRTSYAELSSQVDAVARALLAAGVVKGDRVATLAPPSPDFLVSFLATASVGAIWVGLNPRYQLGELIHVTHDSEPKLLLARSQIGTRNYAEEIAAILAATPSLKTVATFNGEPPVSGATAWADFLAAGNSLAEDELQKARQSCGGRDPCMIVYTSGSTGRPKGALLHHQGIVEFSLAQNRCWPVSTNRCLNYFPINHVGCVVDVSTPALVASGCLIFMEQFDPEQALAAMEREHVTIWASVPSAFTMQLALPNLDDFNLSAVELIVWEGAAMPAETINRLLGFGKPLATNYGMTETTSGITILEPTRGAELLTSSVGSAFPGVEIRLMGNDGYPVAPGEAGEVQARSIYNMLGYWRRPEATDETLPSDGWLRTGDLAVQRPDGRYRIVGRLKEMFKSGGYNVYPREIEQAIEAHPLVDAAAVVSIDDALWQEVGVAFVLPSGAVTRSDLERHCREHLANYKVPKHFVLVEELPLLPIGKVDKKALQQMAADEFRPATGEKITI